MAAVSFCFGRDLLPGDEAMVMTADDMAIGFLNARSTIAPALMDMDLVTLDASFVMIGDILTNFGAREEELVELARESARLRLEPVH
jgi:hypothetical protein